MSRPADKQLSEAELLELLRKDPHAALTLDLPIETLMALRQKLDPYATIVGPTRGKKHIESVALSLTNLREDYMRRFFMTAITGFVFRMQEEYEVPVEERRWQPKKPKGATEPLTAENMRALAEALTTNADMLEKAEAAAKESQEAADDYNKKELVFTEEEMKGALAAQRAAAGERSEEAEEGKTTVIYQKTTKYQELKRAAEKAAGNVEGVRFVSTLMLRDAGIDADLRMPATVKKARQFPNARSVIDDTPGWDRGLLPSGQLEVPPTVAKAIIKNFLCNFFEFNPSAHVSSAYDEVVTKAHAMRDVTGFKDKVVFDPYDPDRLPLKVLLEHAPPQSDRIEDKEPFNLMLKSRDSDDRQRDYNTICRLLTCKHLAAVARYVLDEPASDPDRQERWKRMLMPVLGDDFIKHIPPQDTFHRFKNWCDARYEELRAAVQAIYHDRPDLEYAIQVMKYFEGPPDKVAEEARQFRNEQQNNVIADIKLVDFGGWTFVGEFSENRDVIDIHNDRAKLLQRILKRMEDDNKYGQLLMRQRVRKEKAKNIAEAGPDAPGLAMYKAENPAPGPEAISPEERLRLERARGNLKAADELKFFEEQEGIAKNLESLARIRELTEAEQRQLEDAHRKMAQAREMMEVPENAIQADVFRVNAKEGTMVKDKIYTRAVKPGEAFEDEELSHQNAERDRLIEEIAASARGNENPLEFYPKNSRELAKKAFAEGKAAPDLAPFAQDFLSEQIDKERKERDMKTQKELAEAGEAPAPALPPVVEEGGAAAGAIPAAPAAASAGGSAPEAIVAAAVEAAAKKKDAQ